MDHPCLELLTRMDLLALTKTCTVRPSQFLVSRPHQVPDMWVIATDDSVVSCVCQSLCHMPAPAKLAEWIKVVFGVKTSEGRGTLY